MDKIIRHLNLSADAEKIIKDIYSNHCDDDEFIALSRELREGKTLDEEYGKKYTGFAEKINVCKFELAMTLVVANAYWSRDAFLKKGYDEQLFWDIILDAKYKIDECYEKNGIWGIEPLGWYTRVFNADLFQLGRLQFEEKPLKDGGKVIGMHIPSGAPLTYESVIDAYKKAYDFFPKTHGDLMAFTCYSYLLLPEYQGAVFKEGSNIYNYAKDFCITGVAYEEVFHDGWRIFGPDFDADAPKLPRNTSLQRAFAEYFEKGGKAGEARGVFFFDGENVLKEKGMELKGLI